MPCNLYLMICRRCGAQNPDFFEKCLECGAQLPRADPDARKKKLLLYGVAGAAVLVLTGVLVLFLPAITGLVSGAPAALHSAPVAAVPEITTFAIGEPATYGDLQMTVTGTKDGAVFEDRKFYSVMVLLQNSGDHDTLHFTSGDFPLVDSIGEVISPIGIGDGISYDLAPGSSGTIELRYIVLIRQQGLKLRIDPRVPLNGVSGRGVFYDFLL